MRRAALTSVALVWVTLFAALPTDAHAANTEIQPAEEHFGLILEHDGSGSPPDGSEGTHVLTLDFYPLRGIAVVRTASNNYDIENNDSVAYVKRIPEVPFDGYLDLHFKGLGSFVGDFVAHESSLERRPKGCTGPQGSSQAGDLVGSIEFHGAGYRRWSASHVLAFLRRSSRLHCRPGAAKRERRPKNLFGYISGSPGSFSGWRYILRARLRQPRRLTEMAVFGYERKRPGVNFDAATFEWLPGGIATGRFVNRSVLGGAHLEVSRGGYHPEQATLRPPKPYSGVGIYTRATHRLTGSLAVQFPGLKLRLGGVHTVANLLDEKGLPEKSPSESFAPDLRRTTHRSPDGDAGENATFVGRIDFRGAGGYGRWEASRAHAGILLACGAEPKRENGTAALFGHVAELGPVLDGPAPIQFFADGEVRHRFIEFIAWGGHDPNSVEFDAIDREWLPGEVATERWTKEAPASLKKTVALGFDAAGPASATFTPPAPFFGKGTYSRSTGKLTGSLGVRFLGLKLQLTPSPLAATLTDEDLR